MRKQIWGLMLVAVMAPLSANAYLVSDSYVGGVDHGYGDVISESGRSNWFDIKGLIHNWQ